MSMLWIVLASALLSWGLLQLLIPLLRRHLLDHPNVRSSHHHPTPRGGGVAFVLVAALASGLALTTAAPAVSGWPAEGMAGSVLSWLSLLTLPLALVGFLDDRHNLPASWRYGVQLLNALLLLLVSPLVRGLALSPVLPLPWLALLLPLLLIAITAVINFTNFIDGLDGLVAGCLAVALAATALRLAAPWPVWALVGALLGFLRCNWSPARVFMGDVGSTFLGAIFSAVVLQAPSWPEALGLLLLATPLLGDAFLCVLRRQLAGQCVFEAHRLHLFQRLHQAGWPHERVSLLYIVATALLALALWGGGWLAVVLLALLELLLGLWLDQHVAVPFAVASIH